MNRILLRVQHLKTDHENDNPASNLKGWEGNAKHSEYNMSENAKNRDDDECYRDRFTGNSFLSMFIELLDHT